MAPLRFGDALTGDHKGNTTKNEHKFT